MKGVFALLLGVLVSQMALAERAVYEDALIIHTPRVVLGERDRWRSVRVRNISEVTGYYEVYVEPARQLTDPSERVPETLTEDTAAVAAPVATDNQRSSKVLEADGPAGIAHKFSTVDAQPVQAASVEPHRPLPVEDIPAHLLEELIEVTPAQLVIRADEEQMLEVTVSLPDGLPEGEYHSRLVFRQLPSPEQVQAQSAEEAEQLAALDAAVPAEALQAGGAVKVRIKRPEYGVPVVLRQGHRSVTAALSEPEFFQDAQGMWLEVLLSREGNRSLFGDFKLYGRSVLGVKPEVLMIRKYVALDMPETERRVKLRLPAELDLVLYEQLQLEFRERKRFGGQEGAKLIINLTD